MKTLGDCLGAISNKQREILKDDLELVENHLATADSYDFVTDVRERMAKIGWRGLSANGLAKRCLLSHTAVNNWLSGQDRPNGKERMKELGLALGLGPEELNLFLFRNAYPRLYSKNPLDDVCKWVLRHHQGEADIVSRYRQELKTRQVKRRFPLKKRVAVNTDFLSQSLARLESDRDFDRWLEQHADSFTESDKNMLPSRDLILLAMLILGRTDLNEIYDRLDLAAALPKQINSIKGGREISFRGLRSKLIILGLHFNMAEEDLGLLTELARLLPFTRPATKTDIAVLSALRLGHDRYPLYEYDYLWPRHHDLVDILSDLKIKKTPPPPLYERLLKEYRQRLAEAELRALAYEEARGAAEKDFEDYYTDLAENSGRGLLDYVGDLLLLLTAKGLCPEKESLEFVEMAGALRLRPLQG